MPESSSLSSATSFSPDDATFFRKRIHMGKLYEYVLTTVPPSLDETINQPTRDLYKRYRERVELRSGPVRCSRGCASLRHSPEDSWARRLFSSKLPSCFLWLPGFLRPLAPFRLAGLVALIFFLAPAGNALTVALIHALDNSRYRGSYGPLLLFALCGPFFFALTTCCLRGEDDLPRHCVEARP